jgi:Domain of unknown function (DUF4166)
MKIFEPVFGVDWQKLPPVFHKRYANNSFSNDIVPIKGIMDIKMSWLFKLLSPFMKMMGLLIPFEGKFEAIVNFKSEMHSDAYMFNRIIQLSPDRTYVFNSKMFPQGGNIMLEHLAFGLRWKAAYHFDGSRVIISHLGYQLFGLPLPLHWLFGKGHAFEAAIDDNRFMMQMTITHALFGELYRYSGEFCHV